MKIARIVTAAALLSPLALAAQQQPARPAPPADPVTQAGRDVGGHFGGLLLAAFDSIPAARYGYRPTPPQQSAGYVAQHLEDANYILCERLGGTTHPRTAKDSLADSVKARWPKDTLVARLRASLLFCRDAFARLDDAEMGDPVTLGPPGAGSEVTRARALLLFVTDLAEHYSQVASYMRQMGMVPPSALRRPGP